MTKRSNPTRSVPHVDVEAGEMLAGRSRTDFAGARERKARRGIAPRSEEASLGVDRPRGTAEMQAGWAARGEKRPAETRGTTAHLAGRKRRRVEGANGSFPASPLPPKPPPVLVLYEDLVAAEDLAPEPVYGQFPRALIAKLLPWLRCARHKLLHVCSGSLPPGEGIRVDIRPEAKPDIVADGRALPLPDGSQDAVLIDPPYSEHYAKALYGVEYPRPSHLLREAARVVRPGGRIGLVHYITAKPPSGTRFVKAFGLSTGFDMPMRAVSIYERDQPELAL